MIKEKLFNLVPERVLYFFGPRFNAIRLKKLKDKVVKELSSSNDEYLKNISQIVKNNIPYVYYGEWVKKYNIDWTKKIFSDGNNFFYNFSDVNNSVRKLYFPSSYSKREAAYMIRNLIMEQDELSPHLYLTKKLLDNFKSGFNTVIDIGSAEGNFALSLASITKKMYLFEYDENWIDALKLTMKDYLNKVTIVKKFVSDVTDDKCITLDDYFCDNIPNDISIIKMDIEGAEESALRGMKKVLDANPHAVLLVCAYHKHDAYDNICKLLNNYDILPRDGFMMEWGGGGISDFIYPYARYGVLECTRKIK